MRRLLLLKRLLLPKELLLLKKLLLLNKTHSKLLLTLKIECVESRAFPR